MGFTIWMIEFSLCIAKFNYLDFNDKKDNVRQQQYKIRGFYTLSNSRTF